MFAITVWYWRLVLRLFSFWRDGWAWPLCKGKPSWTAILCLVTLWEDVQIFGTTSLFITGAGTLIIFFRTTCIPNSLTTTSFFFSRCSLASYAIHAFGRQYQYGQEALHVWSSVYLFVDHFPTSSMTERNHWKIRYHYSGCLLGWWSLCEHILCSYFAGNCASSPGCCFSKPRSQIEICLLWFPGLLSLLLLFTVFVINVHCYYVDYFECHLSHWLQMYVDIRMYTTSTLPSTLITITC